MAYNYGPPPGFGQPQSYSSYGNGAPGMNGASAPGLPPGMPAPPGGMPGGAPMNFSQMQMPPGINFNASVIRMTGKDGRGGGRPGGYDAPGRDQGTRGRTGLGAESGRSNRETNLQPLTKEEVARTIYIGGLVDGVPSDIALEEILNAGQGLHRWSRVTDADNKPLDFGFAEYEDAASVEIAAKLFTDLEVPLKKDGAIAKDEDGNVVKAKLIVIVDPQTEDYIKQWSKSDEDELQFKIESAQDNLRSVIAGYTNRVNTGEDLVAEADGGVDYGAQASEQAELLALPTAAEDELADIPADMRETVAAEIAAFRERSNLRDMERLKMEEEMEQAERERSRGSRYNRLASPPPSAPRGPAGAPNGAPSGPRGDANGSKAINGVQIPKDYVNGVNFTTGEKEDETEDISDEERERRRRERREKDLEEQYLKAEKSWLRQERVHTEAVARQKAEDAHEQERRDRKKSELAQRLKDFDQTDDAQTRKHLYFSDRREFNYQRRHERQADDSDRRAEDRERDRERERTRPDRSRSASRARPSRAPVQEKAGFSLNLGGFGPAPVAEEPPRQAQMESLLSDADATATSRPQLKRFDLKPLAPGETMSEDEKRAARAELARGITNDAAELFSWDVKWASLPGDVVRSELRPYVADKIQEAVGVAEDLLVGGIEKIILAGGKAEEVVSLLEEVLDEDAVDVAKKIWKMVVFYSEAGAGGLMADSGR